MTSLPLAFREAAYRCPARATHRSLRTQALYARGEREIDLPDDATAEVVEGEFVDACMGPLSSALRAIDAIVVLSTTWRETAPQRRAVDAQLARHGLPCHSSCTPSLPQLRGGRSAEILQWVAEHRPSRWLAIDDNAMLAQGLPADNFLQTEPSRGFTETDAERVRTSLGAARK